MSAPRALSQEGSPLLGRQAPLPPAEARRREKNSGESGEAGERSEWQPAPAIATRLALSVASGLLGVFLGCSVLCGREEERASGCAAGDGVANIIFFEKPG